MAPRPLGLPRPARLLRPGDFAALRKTGQRISGRHFLAESTVNAFASARLGLAVSRRVSKRAVTRNRIKRVARDSFRHVRADLPTLDILLIARASAAETDNAGLREDLARLWQRIAALKGDPRTGTMRA